MKANDARIMADKHNRFKWLEDLIKEACRWGKYELLINEEVHVLKVEDLEWLTDNGYRVVTSEDTICGDTVWTIGWGE